jgi:hypothetical protein
LLKGRSAYPGYNALDQFDHWDEKTQKVIRQRLHNIPPLTFFNPEEAHRLAAVAERIIPQAERSPDLRVPVAPFIDETLAKNETEGFREPDMPWHQEAWRLGLVGIEETSQALYKRPFVELDDSQQDSVLVCIEKGAPPGQTWKQVPARKFFQQLVEQVATVYYAHPLAWSEIGWAGPASPRGYVRIGYGMRDPWEPVEKAAASSVEIVRRRRMEGQAGMGNSGEATH